MSIRFFTLLTSVFFLSACGPSLESRLEHLVVAKDLWTETNGCQAYSYELRTNYSSWRRVNVSEPCREPIDWINSPPEGGFGDGEFEPTIEDLFVVGLEFTKLHHSAGGNLEIEYNDSLGYPTRILWDDQGSFHSAFALEVRDLRMDTEGA